MFLKKSTRTGKITKMEFSAGDLKLRKNALTAEEKAPNIFLTIENCVQDVTTQKKTSKTKTLEQVQNFEL